MGYKNRLELAAPGCSFAGLGSQNEAISFSLFSDYEPLISVVKEVARSEKDAFYRYQFDRVAAGASAAVTRLAEEEEQRQSSRFGALYDDDSEDDYDEDDDFEDEDEDDFDDECDCSSCRADRARRVRTGRSPDDQEDDVARESNESMEGGNFPPIVVRVFSKLGTDGVSEFRRIYKATCNEPTPNKFINKAGMLLARHGMTPNETAEFLVAFVEALEDGASSSLDNSNEPMPNARTFPEMTAQERKASRKQREKELENRKRQSSQSRSRR